MTLLDLFVMFQAWTPTTWFYQVTKAVKPGLLNAVAFFLFVSMRQMKIKHWLRSEEAPSSFAAGTFFRSNPDFIPPDMTSVRQEATFQASPQLWRPLVDRRGRPTRQGRTLLILPALLSVFNGTCHLVGIRQPERFQPTEGRYYSSHTRVCVCVWVFVCVLCCNLFSCMHKKQSCFCVW